MQWLVRLVTPPNGLVLDPFAGTGTTGEAAFREGMRAILIECEAEYQNDIRRRMQLVLGGREERQRAGIKARGLTADPGPLFEAAGS
jgi:site-specific DNA-methyltransferase (adenine-specific)